jgi:phage gp36-like protein
MRYCSVADVRIALTESGETTDTNTAADMDDITISDAILEASAQIDPYIAGPYSPADDVPAIITYWCRDIAAFLATCTWRKSKDFAAMDPVLLRYQRVTTMLDGIAAGSIVVPGNGPSGSSGGATVINQYNFTLFHPRDFDLIGAGAGIDAFAYNGWYGYAG